jgi:hypothetical protein
MSNPINIVFLFDVDNTLIDNDRVQADLKEHLEQEYGIAARDRYWEILEKLRNELGYVDYLGALERFRMEAIHRPDVLGLFPFRAPRRSDPSLSLPAAVVERWGVAERQRSQEVCPKPFTGGPSAGFQPWTRSIVRSGNGGRSCTGR